MHERRNPRAPPTFSEILRLLPHRYPFLMIDRVIDIRGDDHGIGIKNVTINEPHFTGHFPDNPVMPGVLMIEGMAQTAGVLVLRLLPPPEKQRGMFFLTIDKAKFRKPARAGRHPRISRRQDRAPPQHVVVSRRGEGRRRAHRRSRSRRHYLPRTEMAAIDPTARVADGARIGEGVEIGPYCLVGPHVELGRRRAARRPRQRHRRHHDRRGHDRLSVRFARHAAAIGALSRRPDQADHRRTLQDPRRRDDEYRHRGRRRHHARSATRCFFMVASHVAHDCDVGNDVTFANNAVLGGHVTIGDNVFLGGNVGGASVRPHRRRRHDRRPVAARDDIIPFGFAIGQIGDARRPQYRRPAPARRYARRTASAAAGLSRAFFGEGVFADRIDKVATAFADDPLGAKGHCVHPRRRQAAADASAARRRPGTAKPMVSEARGADGMAAGSGEPIAIICGGGSFPGAVAEAVKRRGRRPVMFAVRGWADPKVVERYAHHWIAIGQAGRFFRLARAEGCREVVFIGTLLRPPLTQIRPDWQMLG